MSDKATAILATLVVYKLALVAIGLWTARRTRDAADFFLGGRGLGPWVAAISASASSSSAWTLLGVSGYAYAYGLSALWILPACVGGFALNWYVLAPRLRRIARAEGALTVTDLLAGPRTSRAARAVAAVASAIVLASLLTYVAAQFQGAGKTFHEVFGVPTTSSVLLGAGVIVLYTLLGGFWAVSVTDTLQGLLMAATAVLLPLGGLALVGGPAGLAAAIAAVDAPDYLSLAPGTTPAAIGLALGLLGIGLGYPGQPHVVNRFMALRDEAALLRGRRIAMTWALVTYAGMIVVGLCARALPQLAAVDDREVVFYRLAGEAFPPLVAGIMIAAVLSATMSTADSQLLVAASSASHDLRASEHDHRAPAALLLRARLVVVALSAGAVAVALHGNQEIFSHVLFAWSAMGAAFGPLLLVRVLAGPVWPIASLAAMIAGFCLSVAAYATPATSGTAWERVAPFAVALAIAAWPKIQERRVTRPTSAGR
ncbi:MAG: sodium/proline symporter [Nannocystaceae bacterium]